MSESLGNRRGLKELSRRLRERLRQHWEEVFFLFLFVLLSLQVFDFIEHTKNLDTSAKAAIVVFAAIENFIVDYLAFATIPLITFPLVAMILWGKKLRASRRYLDVIGVYIVVRMFIQLIGLNLLLFDAATPGDVLIAQLLFFLPYSLLVWGWIYWRLNEFVASGEQRLFWLDCDRSTPRPIDYLVASFSTVFSASISAIKGRSARAKALIIIHGFFVYNLMGLMLSRAVSLVQSR